MKECNNNKQVESKQTRRTYTISPDAVENSFMRKLASSTFSLCRARVDSHLVDEMVGPSRVRDVRSFPNNGDFHWAREELWNAPMDCTRRKTTKDDTTIWDCFESMVLFGLIGTSSVILFWGLHNPGETSQAVMLWDWLQDVFRLQYKAFCLANTRKAPYCNRNILNYIAEEIENSDWLLTLPLIFFTNRRTGNSWQVSQSMMFSFLTMTSMNFKDSARPTCGVPANHMDTTCFWQKADRFVWQTGLILDDPGFWIGTRIARLYW